VRAPLLRRAASALVLLILSGGCSLPRIQWSQRVRFGGRDFVFARVDSVKSAGQNDHIEYLNGDFKVEGQGPLSVNGYEIALVPEGVKLAGRLVRLEPGQEVRFARDMTWTVHPGAGPPAAAGR